jgi:hypothetical protein
MRKPKKRGVKPGTKRGPYQKIEPTKEFGSLTDIGSILAAREQLRIVVKSRIKQLNQLLKRI